VPDVDNRCPRCGGGFHCGFDDAEPCACTALQLEDRALADLRARYTGCLCLACLREIAASIDPPEQVR
jgi:Cysteine-rich CWC